MAPARQASVARWQLRFLRLARGLHPVSDDSRRRSSTMRSVLTWLGEDALILDDLAFQMTFPDLETKTPIPTQFSERTFCVEKLRSMLENYVGLLEHLRPQRIVEIGIRFGGSTAFLATLSKPEKYVAIDLVDQTSPSFNRWLLGGPHHGRVKTHFGVDQADRTTLRSVIDLEFGNEQLDLVIDDASHILGPARASFEALFPRLRPGGIYVIEDWETQHRLEQILTRGLNSGPEARAHIERELNKQSGSWEELRKPLTHLLFEVVMVSAYTDIVEDVRFQRGFATIRRGSEPIDGERFALSDLYLDLGRELLQWDPGGKN